VKQRFNSDQHILGLMENFRLMMNDCIRIGLAEDKTSLKSLSVACYGKLKDYRVPAVYKLCAISKASGILKHYRKVSKKHLVNVPYCSRLSLATCYGVKVVAGKLRIPGKLEIPLNTYTRRFISQPGVEVRSVTLTPESLSVSVRKKVEPIKCEGIVGIDRNLNNVTIASTNNEVSTWELSKATAIKAQCRQRKRSFRRNDVKIRKRVYQKYGRLEQDRVGWLLHNVSQHCSPSQTEEAGDRHGGSAGNQETVLLRERAGFDLSVEDEFLVLCGAGAAGSV